LPELVRRGLLVEVRDGASRNETPFSFAQHATREAVVRSIPRAKRQKLHRAIAAWLERPAKAGAGGGDDGLADHPGEAGDLARALPYELRAAERAIRVHAVEDATAHLSRCRSILKDAGLDLKVADRRAMELRVTADLIQQQVLAGALAEAVSLA